MEGLADYIQLTKPIKPLLLTLDSLELGEVLVTTFSNVADPAIDQTRGL